MDKLFEKAHRARRNREFILTSTNTNAIYYGSPAWSKKESIWPPLSDGIAITNRETVGHAFSTAPSLTTRPFLPPSSSSSTEKSQDILEGFSARIDVLYHPLHAHGIIRVLEIEAGEFHDLIVCKFHYIDLEAPHLDYNALSYVWGTSYFRRLLTVQCHGRQLEISENLEQAIRHIRLSSKSTFLWADAMCINQEDTRERAHQVSLMAAIYRKARKVIIWLGDVDVKPVPFGPKPLESEDIKAQQAFGAVCEVVNRWQSEASGMENASYSIENSSGQNRRTQLKHFEEYPSTVATSDNPENAHQGRGPDSRDLTGSEQEANGALAPGSALWLSLASLFSCSWFWRVWVIQEAVLAPSAVVRWAHAEIDWKWIGLASAILRTTYHEVCEDMKIRGVYNAYLMFRLSSLSDLPPLRVSFIQLLRLTRQFEASDKRDRIYGLLGIRTVDNDPETGSLYLTPDYSISSSELWMQLACKTILESQNLSLLSSVQYTTGVFGFDFEYLIERPSWVPLWDSVYRATLAPWDQDDQFAAARNFPLHLGSPVTSGNLLVEGIQIGVVGKCSPYMWHDVDTSVLGSSILGEFFTSDAGLRLLARTLTSGRNSYGSLAETSDSCLANFAAYILDCDKRDSEGETSGLHDIVRTRSWAPRRAKSFKGVFSDHPDLEDRLRELASGGDASRFCQSAIPICERRRLFLTLNGFLGLGSDTVREGDVLCVLSGGDLPFVLRPALAGNKKGSKEAVDNHPDVEYYLLVGECYVEGLMQGEGVLAVGGEGSEFAGPVPFQLVEEEILAAADELKEDKKEGKRRSMLAKIKSMKRKHALLNETQLSTLAMLETARQDRTGKMWFSIH